jgi:hypothetical protein
MKRPSTSTYRRLTWADVSEGQVVPEAVDHIDVQRVVESAAANWTYFGGHIDSDYARNVQGRTHIYLATGPIQGMLDGYVTAWAGPEAFLAKRTMRMAESIYAGDDIRFEGTVTKKWIDDSRGYERALISVDIHILNGAGTPCVTATSVYELPAPT